MKEKLPIEFHYRLPASPDQISSFFQKAIEDISQHVSLDEKIQSRIKLILIELCTNFIKHVSIPEGSLKVRVEENCLWILKSYGEDCFKRLVSEKTKDMGEGDIRQIAFSKFNRHYVRIEDQNLLKFLNPYDHNLPVENLKKHYGLFILTLAADSFVYEYNKPLEEDSFKLMINW